MPGGYPELRATRLADNTRMRDRLARHVAQHKPVWAGCGGMMVRFDTLVTVTLHERLAAPGPQRGHTFHYATCATTLTARYRTARPGCELAPDAGEARYRVGPIRARYFHAWFASSPVAAAELVAWTDSPSTPFAGVLHD